MKILKILVLILNIVAIVCIPISMFSDVSGKIIIGMTGYISLFVGAILNIIVSIIGKRDDNKIKLKNKNKAE